MPQVNCFDAPTLQNYLLGKLSDEQSDVVAAHLEACLNCEATVSQLDRASDTLTNGLKLPTCTAEPAADAELQMVLDKVRSLEPDDSRRESSVAANDRSPVLRDYRLLEPLGFGGMGQVFKAVHTRLDKLVAVKLLPARRLGDVQAVARFQREMRVIGQLSHPAIVQATDAGEVDGTHFLVMEYVEGCDLNTLAKDCGTMSVADACEIARQAAVGLEYAHQQGIVHRDIKPSNLMLTRGEGRVVKGEEYRQTSHSPLAPPPSPLIKILDLGLALLSGVQAPVDELTTVGQLMGTLDYMAPEQLEDSHLVGPRADIYALAATLFRLLTGFAPFANENRKTPLQKLRALATQAAPPIRERRADLPFDLAVIIDRALSRDPSKRFVSMNEFAAALTPWCAGHDLPQLVGHVSNVPAPAVELPSLRHQPRSHVRQNVGESAIGPRSGERGYAIKETPNARIGHVENVPHVSPPRRSLLITIAVLFLAALGVVITIETNKGTLIVESVRDGVEVRVKKSGKSVEKLELTTGPKSTRLAAGEYEIELVGDADGLRVDRQKVELTRGGEVLVRVTEVPAVATIVPTTPKAGAGLGPMVGSLGITSAVSSPDIERPAPELDDEKPNPNAKGIDQFLAEDADRRSETKYREALRRPLDLKVDDQPLVEAVRTWQKFAELPIWIDEVALTDEGIATDAPINIKFEKVSLETAMLLTLRPLQLAYFWDDTQVVITTAAKANEKLVNRSYPVGRSLPMVRKAVRLLEANDVERRIELIKSGVKPVAPAAPSGGGGFFGVPTPLTTKNIPGCGATCAHPASGWASAHRELSPALGGLTPCRSPLDDRLHFQFGGGGGFGGAGGVDGYGIPLERTAVSYYAHLLELLTNAQWMDSDGEGGTVSLLGDVLFVRQTLPAHQQVEAALRILEQAAAGPLPNSPVEIRRPDYPLDGDRKLAERLAEVIEVEIGEAFLRDALRTIEPFAGIQVLLDEEKLNEEGIASDSLVQLPMTKLPLKAVLQRVLDPLQLAVEIEEGLLIVTTKAAAKERLVTRVYEVRKLLARGIEGDDLIASLESGTTGPWMNVEGEGGETTVFADRLLYVTQTRPNHDEVAVFLRDLDAKLGQQPAKKPGSSKPKPLAQSQGGFGGAPTPAPVVTQPEYDGKTFDQWLAVLDVERSPARLTDALEALRLLGDQSRVETVAERVLKIFRMVEIPPNLTATDGPTANLLASSLRLFKTIRVSVLQKYCANELRSGTLSSRKFVLLHLNPLQDGLTNLSGELANAMLAATHDTDRQIRESALQWVLNVPLDERATQSRTILEKRLREALQDKEGTVALLAASKLIDSEADTPAVVNAIRIVVDYQQDDYLSWANSYSRFEAVKQAAAMGPRAAPAAKVIARVLLESSYDGAGYSGGSHQMGHGIGAVRTVPSPGFQAGPDLMFKQWATVALARCGKAAAETLPTIKEALTKQTSEDASVEDPETLLKRDSFTLTLYELLLATQARLEETPPLDLSKPSEIKLTREDLALTQANWKLLRVEQSLLKQHHGADVDNSTLRELDQKVKAADEQLRAVSALYRAQRKVGQSDKPKPASEPSKSKASNDGATARYDGKTFDEWLAVLDVERSPARQREAYVALLNLKSASQEEALAQKLLARFRSDHAVGLSGSNVTADIDGLLSSLKPDVLKRALAEELLKGNSRSRLFALAMLRNKRDFDLRLSVLEASRDTEPDVRREAMSWLDQRNRQHPKDEAAATILSRLREGLADKDAVVRFFAARGLLDSEQDSKEVAATLATQLENPRSGLRVTALESLALMGERASNTALTIAQLKFEPGDEPLNSARIRWTSPRKRDRRGFSERELAVLALARMGKLADGTLPTITEIISNSRDFGPGFNLEMDATGGELLRAVKLRIEESPAPENLGSSLDLNTLSQQLSQVAGMLHLLRLETEFLRANDRNAEADKLLEKSKTLSEEFDTGILRRKQLNEDNKKSF